MRRGTRPRGGRRRQVGIFGFALTAILALFHGGLLWQRLADGSLLQPIVVARWAASVLLVGALLQLWRAGLPVLRGRRAGVLWLIVALLHAVAPGASLPAVAPAAEGVLPAALAMLAFLALAAAAAAARLASAPRRLADRPHDPPRRSSTGWYRVLFSRPPPAPRRP